MIDHRSRANLLAAALVALILISAYVSRPALARERGTVSQAIDLGLEHVAWLTFLQVLDVAFDNFVTALEQQANLKIVKVPAEQEKS